VAGLFGGGDCSVVYTWLDPRGLTTALARVLLGPWTDSSRPRSGGGHLLRCPPLGRYLHGGIVVIIIVHLEWGSSSSSNTYPFWAEPNVKHIYINKTPRLGMGGAQVAAILVQGKPGSGAPRAGLRLRPGGEYIG
jgi:hypothetical protein